MFHHLLRSDIPETEKMTARLNAEAVSFLGAGTYPTAATLIFVTYYILADPKIEARLRNDLKNVMANFDEEVSQLDVPPEITLPEIMFFFPDKNRGVNHLLGAKLDQSGANCVSRGMHQRRTSNVAPIPPKVTYRNRR